MVETRKSKYILIFPALLLLLTVPSRPQIFSSSTTLTLGTYWKVKEPGYIQVTWKRRPNTLIFDGLWLNAEGIETKEVLEIETLKGNAIVIVRRSRGGRYSGTISADGRHVNGHASWLSSGQTWSATIFGTLPSNDSPDHYIKK